MNDPIWEDHHHSSLFLSSISSVDNDFASLFSTNIVNTPQTTILLQDTDSEGNLCNITQTNPIDISTKPSTIEHIHVGQNCLAEESEAYRALFKEFCDIFAWSYEEMLGDRPIHYGP